MIELEKIYVLIAKNPHNFSIYQIIKMILVLYNVYIVFKN